ncbi:peptidoglycan recognition protein isoform X2 [Stomoxys calcitrans]|uniref:Peptidoglycan recognition protein family domain-containing protein n=1 Tax=Stomoxys calcitrans TaxID=35570 RepID=A0A1I8NPU2_STOCA|nr:peptidoglycan recognition protein isoform X2 [Stomoxys calcitrans]
MSMPSQNEKLRLSEEKARSWLTSIDPSDLDDLESVVDSIVDSDLRDSSDTESDHLSDSDEEQYNDISQLKLSNELNGLEQIVSRLAPPSFGNVSMNNCSNVVLGNIIKLKINVKNDKDEESTCAEEREENTGVEQPVIVNRTKKPVYRPACLIIPRARWLAMEPLNDYNPIDVPVDLVIISHTATTSSTKQAENIGIIRDIQTFHIETRGWDDIGYNFLIGCDGNVYEGRGWGVEGAHTFKYNNLSIGISFIGCFIQKLPSPRALEACKNLLKLGVEEGHLTTNFKLLGHRQCMSTQSPGNTLYDEIKTWEHFQDLPQVDMEPDAK